MFERLASRLLNNALHQWFESSHDVETDDQRAASLGVWSGYISLEHLHLKKAVVNDWLEQQGLPFELLHCTIRRVEITVPWSKLKSSSNAANNSEENNSSSSSSSGAIVVIVMDGIHVLLRTNYQFQDDKMRQRDVQNRRKKLDQAESFVPPTDQPQDANNRNNKWFNVKEFVKKRISGGIVQQLADKLHVHIRDLHVRWEDAQSDPERPFACGIVMESMHVQHNEQEGTNRNNSGEDDVHEFFAQGDDTPPRRNREQYQQPTNPVPGDVIRKVAQVNHYAVYWNALEYGDTNTGSTGLPLENTVLHQLPSMMESPHLLAAALDRGIARRASALLLGTTTAAAINSNTPQNAPGRLVIPQHTYLLMPLDCTLQANLSLDPASANVSSGSPVIQASCYVEAIHLQLRDFQCHQVTTFLQSFKEHNFTKPYRRFRPLQSVKDNPRAWWLYAFCVIRHELKGGRLRWSWSRWRQRDGARRRYCELYERHVRQLYSHNESLRRGSSAGDDLASMLEATFDTTPDDGAGPSSAREATADNGGVRASNGTPQLGDGREALPLSEEEVRELREMEDGIRGDIPVQDLLLFRLLVNRRMGQDYVAQRQRQQQELENQRSWWFGNASVVQNAIYDDAECQQEYRRLLAYLDHSSYANTLIESGDDNDQRRCMVFLSFKMHSQEGRLTVFSPLPSTSQEPSWIRRLHERFLELTFDNFRFGVLLMRDFDTASLRVSLRDYRVSEIRSNQNQQTYPILARRKPGETRTRVPLGSAACNHNGSLMTHNGPLLENETRDNEDELMNQNPLVIIEIQINPPKQAGYDVSVRARVEAVEVVLIPDCQWIPRAKAFLRFSSTSGQIDLGNYWKDLSMASINSWASRKLGLRAKAATALERHKTVHVDIHADCPVIRIVGRGKTLWVDLGRAHLKTAKLAGVASAHLNVTTVGASQATRNGEFKFGGAARDRSRSLNTAGQYEDVTEKSTNMQSFSAGQTARASSPGIGSYMDVPSPSFNFDNTSIAPRSVRRLGEMSMDWEGETAAGHHFSDPLTSGRKLDDFHSSLFYDVYQLQIETGDTRIEDHGEDDRDEKVNATPTDPLLRRLQLEVTIHKSIIPADHTLFRFQFEFVVQEVAVTLSSTVILQIAGISETWKGIVAAPDGSGDIDIVRPRDSKQHLLTSLSPHYAASMPEVATPQSNETVTGSQIDENDFFDAVENEENSANASMWHDDNWIADAESVLDDDGHTPSRRHKRRSKVATSDVSSLSDRSLKKRQRPNDSGAYLNEENLARLEEGMAEGSENDTYEDGSDSFHSALSPRHLADLMAELDSDIQQANQSLALLQVQLNEMSTAHHSSSSLDSGSTKHRRILRKSLKVEQERLNATVNEMMATRIDLAMQLSEMKGTAVHDGTTVDVGNSARRATALLNARKMHEELFKDGALQHSLTRNLNPQLIEFTLVLNELIITIAGVETETQASDSQTFRLCASQSALTLRHSVNETKIYFGIDYINAGVTGEGTVRGSEWNQYVLLAGAQYSANSGLLPSHFPQYISAASMEDRFLRSTIDLRHRAAVGSKLSEAETMKVRLAVGDIEMVPTAPLVSSINATISRLQEGWKTGRRPVTTNSQKPQRKYTFATMTDVGIRIAAVRASLDHSGRTVGAIAITEISSRFAKFATGAASKCRHQLDLRCSNIQVLHIEDLRLGKGSEVFGRKDPYCPVLQLRLRSQLVPSQEMGGWVVGSPSSHEVSSQDKKVWNVHLGMQIHSLGVVVSPYSISQLRGAFEDLKTIRIRNDAVYPISSSGSKTDALSAAGTHTGLPTRWRVDIAIKKGSLAIQKQTADGQDWDFREGSRSILLLSWTMLAMMEDSTTMTKAVTVNVVLSDFSLVGRAFDDMPIFEPTEILLKGRIAIETKHTPASHPRLKLSVESPWNEISAIMHRHGWDASCEEINVDTPTTLTVLVSSAKIYLSVPLFGALAESMNAVRGTDPRKAQNAAGGDASPPSLDKSKRREFDCSVSIRTCDVTLCREAGGKSMDSFTSLSLAGVEISAEKRHGSLGLQLCVSNALIYDLASRPGVCAVSQKCVGDQTDLRTRNDHMNRSLSDFMTLQLQMTEELQGPSDVSVKISWGNIQCIILPTLVNGLLNFSKGVKAALSSGRQVTRRQTCNDDRIIPKNSRRLFLSFDVEGFEAVLATKEIFGYIREHNQDPINVVSLRWRSSTEVVLAGTDLSSPHVLLSVLQMNQGRFEVGDEGLLQEVIHRYEEQVNPLPSSIFASRVALSVYGFQVLRTSIVPQTCPNTRKDHSPFFFRVYPPAAGEQLVTSSFDFKLVHHGCGSLTDVFNTREPARESRGTSIEISQALRLEAQLVDVLVYIAQSSGGLNDALKVTVTPIVELLKAKKDEREKLSEKSEMVRRQVALSTENSLIGACKRASTIFSVSAEGVRVTFVPGGATRLTESPIIKMALLDIKFGMALCPAPADGKILAEATLDKMVKKDAVVPGLRELHLSLGAWLHCELSASYHNRRLVAWEPLIEPWRMDVRFGADLVQLLKFKPIPRPTLNRSVSALQTVDNPYSMVFGDLVKGESTSERLMDFRKLLRSPFRRSVGDEREANQLPPGLKQLDGLGYLVLALASHALISSALHPSILNLQTQGENRTTNLLVTLPLPNSSPLKWLACFGQLHTPQHESGNQSFQPSVTCSISDENALNVNITGALIENVVTYLRQEKSRTAAPHWIRNDSGLTIRFREILDEERIMRGEKPTKATLSNGSEVPLTLKRKVSQSCDPHRAFLFVELGSFEDTVGRIDHQEFTVKKGALSSAFFYKSVTKIPVDTVGVHRYPLDRNSDLRANHYPVGSDTRSIGWIIVRVALRGGIKLVSIESPLTLKNHTDADQVCEIRSHDRLSLIWRCLVPKAGVNDTGKSAVPVPVDIVPYIHEDTYEFSLKSLPRNSRISHESELGSHPEDQSVLLHPPPPFSQASVERGLIGQVDATLKACCLDGRASSLGNVHFNVCSLRIGTIEESALAGSPTAAIPEQRMLLFRSPLAIRNYLAFPVLVEVKVKPATSTFQDHERLWESLGVIDCGQTVSWTGACAMEEVILRVKFADTEPDISKRFVEWSSHVTITTIQTRRGSVSHEKSPAGEKLPKMRVIDTSGVPLEISTFLSGETKTGDASTYDDIRDFSSKFAVGGRVVSLYVPYWIVDDTGQNLEFTSRKSVAGQFDARDSLVNDVDTKGEPGLTMGLAELLEDAKLSYLKEKATFTLLMIGDERSKKLAIRQRKREHNGLEIHAPWSESIHLRAAHNTRIDVTVMPPSSRKLSDSLGPNSPSEPYAFRTRIVSAPTQFGGSLGTKLVHVVCRYVVVNEMGREIEIIADHCRGVPVLVRADGRPKPFHFDDSRPIQFRPKEFGWCWSGRFFIKADRREVTVRLRHKLKGHTIIANAEIHSNKKSGTSVIVFRPANHPPFRLENHTMHPLQFVQTFLSNNENDITQNREVASSETILLPYHHTDFAWDEPEHRRRSVRLETADFGDQHVQSLLGRFNLDRIAPGTDLRMDCSLFSGQVIADGPTRVLRITESAMPRLPRSGLEAERKFQTREEDVTPLTFVVNVKLSHGVGVSVVDKSPQELIYFRMDDVTISQMMDTSSLSVDIAIGSIVVDNQLWVSPYPVLLEMGSRRSGDPFHISRRKIRRHSALSLSWCQSLSSGASYGDLTLLKRLNVCTAPISVFVDGNLVHLASGMIKQAFDKGFEIESTSCPRNAALRKALDMAPDVETQSKSNLRPADIYSAGDAVVTAALAAKSRHQQVPRLSSTMSSTKATGGDDLSKPRRKCYIENLSISKTQLEISWSGSLPFFSQGSLIPLSLTFEGFPLLLRAFSSSHAYGTIADHLQSLKSHYLSIWRAFDLWLGFAVKPTFLINACLVTWSESLATILGSVSRKLLLLNKALGQLQQLKQPQPVYEDDSSQPQGASKGFPLWTVFTPCVNLTSSMLQSSANVAAFWSSLFRYDLTKFGSGRRRQGGLVRCRNPRLFENVDGKDLLVEYVEGENSGKALLSRVRMGIHLGEGYVYHADGIYQKTSSGRWAAKRKSPVRNILMMTMERILLLNGDISLAFCSVVWEATFDNFIYVEVMPSENEGYDILIIWYLSSVLQPESSRKEDRSMVGRHSKSDRGLENLCCLGVYAPQSIVDPLTSKMLAAKEGCDLLHS